MPCLSTEPPWVRTENLVWGEGHAEPNWASFSCNRGCPWGHPEGAAFRAMHLHRCLVAQLCPPFCNPVGCSPPGSSVLELLQARIPQWVAISLSRRSSPPRDRTPVSCIADRFFTTEPPGKPFNLYLTNPSLLFTHHCFHFTQAFIALLKHS